jgi:serine/threonine-protein kinase
VTRPAEDELRLSNILSTEVDKGGVADLSDEELELLHRQVIARSVGSAEDDQLNSKSANARIRAAEELLLLIEQVRLAESNELASLPANHSTEKLHGALTTDFEAPQRSSRQPRSRIGRFEVLRLLGKGGRGLVYRAYDHSLERHVALKVPRLKQLSSEELRRFEREARVAAALSHPNLVPVFDYGCDEGLVFIAAEYIEGENLSDWLHRQPRPVDEDEAAQMLVRLCEAIHYAHQRGVWHRDLKPSNVLVHFEEPLVATSENTGPARGQAAARQTDSNSNRKDQPAQAEKTCSLADRLRITDFGLAKFSDDSSSLTGSGDLVGTPAYMAPELIASSNKTDSSTFDLEKRSILGDVYGLGTIFYELLTAKAPYSGASPLEILHQVRSREIAAPQTLRQGLSPDLAAVAMKALERDPRRRYPSAAAFADDLRNFLQLRPVSARHITFLGRAARWSQRQPAIATLSALAALLLLSTLVSTSVGYFFTNKALERERSAKTEADIRYQQTRQAVNQFFLQVTEDVSLQNPGLKPLRKKLLQQALIYYQNFANRGTEDPELIDDMIEANWRIGRILTELGENETATGHLAEALSMQEQQIAINGNTVPRQYRQAMIRVALAESKKAIRIADGIPELELVVEQLESLRNAEMIAGDPAFDWGRLDLDYCGVLISLGAAYRRDSRFDKSEQVLNRANEFIESIDAADPSDALLRYKMGVYMSLGNLLDTKASETENPNRIQARQLMQSAIDIASHLVDRPNPAYLDVSNLASTNGNLANMLDAAGRPAEAIPLIDTSIAAFQRAKMIDPLSPTDKLCRAHRLRAYLLAKCDRVGEAEADLKAIPELLEHQIALVSEDQGLKKQLAKAELELGKYLWARDRPTAAKAALENSVAGYQAFEIARTDPFVILYSCEALEILAEIATSESAEVEASQYREQAVDLRQSLPVDPAQYHSQKQLIASEDQFMLSCFAGKNSYSNRSTLQALIRNRFQFSFQADQRSRPEFSGGVGTAIQPRTDFFKRQLLPVSQTNHFSIFVRQMIQRCMQVLRPFFADGIGTRCQIGIDQGWHTCRVHIRFARRVPFARQLEAANSLAQIILHYLKQPGEKLLPVFTAEVGKASLGSQHGFLDYVRGANLVSQLRIELSIHVCKQYQSERLNQFANGVLITRSTSLQQALKLIFRTR